MVFRPKKERFTQTEPSEESITKVDQEIDLKIIKSTTSVKLNEAKVDDVGNYETKKSSSGQQLEKNSSKVKAEELKSDQPKVILRNSDSKTRRDIALNNLTMRFSEHIAKANSNVESQNIKTEKKIDSRPFSKANSARINSDIKSKRHSIAVGSQMMQIVEAMTKYSNEVVLTRENPPKKSNKKTETIIQSFQDEKSEAKKTGTIKQIGHKQNRLVNNYMERLIEKMVNPFDVNGALTKEPSTNTKKPSNVSSLKNNSDIKTKRQPILADNNYDRKSTIVPAKKIFKEKSVLKKANEEPKKKRKKLVTFKYPVHQVISYTTQKQASSYLRSSAGKFAL